jgi:GT2 family glycosyltransferase
VVAEFAAAKKAPRHVLETRQGANFARNRGVNESTGEILVFGDDDILARPDWLREMVAPFVADPAGRIASVGGEVVPVFPEGCPDWVRGFHGPQALRPDTGPTREGQVPMSANLAFRREALMGIGLFDTSVTREGGKQFSSDENVLTRKLRAAGREIWFAPAAVVQHQMPAGRTTFAYVRRHAFDSARSRVIDRLPAFTAAGKPRESRGVHLGRRPPCARRPRRRGPPGTGARVAVLRLSLSDPAVADGEAVNGSR